MMARLSSTIERLSGKGSTAHFGVVGNRLRAFENGETFGAHEVIIRRWRRHSRGFWRTGDDHGR